MNIKIPGFPVGSKKVKPNPMIISAVPEETYLIHAGRGGLGLPFIVLWIY
jgi:hypothetical protein